MKEISSGKFIFTGELEPRKTTDISDVIEEAKNVFQYEKELWLIDHHIHNKEFLSKFSTDKKFKDQNPTTRAVLNFLTNYVTSDTKSFLEVENYSVKLKPTAKVKIYDAEKELKDLYLIRAIIEVIEKNQCEIIYTLPSFFKQLNL